MVANISAVLSGEWDYVRNDLEAVIAIARAAEDQDFTGGGDRIRYSVAVDGAEGPFRVEAEICYQSIGHRWAMNLRAYDAEEPRRFLRYYEPMAATSALALARATATN